jgi:hypothetical protein
VGLSSGENSGVGFSPKRSHSEQKLLVSSVSDSDRAILPQMLTVVEDLHNLVVEIREGVSRPLSPCLESAGDVSYAWRGNLVMDSAVSGMIGLGLSINHMQRPLTV